MAGGGAAGSAAGAGAAAGGAAGSAAYLVGVFGPAVIEVTLARIRGLRSGDGPDA